MPRTDIPAWKLKVTERPVALPARVCVDVVWGWRWPFFKKKAPFVFLRGFPFTFPFGIAGEPRKRREHGT